MKPTKDKMLEVLDLVWKDVYDEEFKAISTLIENQPEIDFSSWFYKNCQRQRKEEAKICQDCPFRKNIEEQEIRDYGEEK